VPGCNLESLHTQEKVTVLDVSGGDLPHNDCDVLRIL
jgi:hypothetical protein